MSEFKKGDRVHVEFDGVIDYVNERGGTFEINAGDLNMNPDYIPPEFIKLAEPAYWPPRIGDIWATDDNEFFVREHRGQPGKYFLEGAESEPHPSTYSSSLSLDVFKALNPRLVRRRGQ